MPGGRIEWEHHPGGEFVLRFKPPLPEILPKEARGHIKAARKETLLTLRSLIDAAIGQMEEAEKKRQTKIEVE